MSKKSLGIMFLVGLGMVGISMLVAVNGGNIMASGMFFILLVPLVIGGLLMILSGSSLLKRLNRHMDGN